MDDGTHICNTHLYIHILCNGSWMNSSHIMNNKYLNGLQPKNAKNLKGASLQSMENSQSHSSKGFKFTTLIEQPKMVEQPIGPWPPNTMAKLSTFLSFWAFSFPFLPSIIPWILCPKKAYQILEKITFHQTASLILSFIRHTTWYCWNPNNLQPFLDACMHACKIG